MRIINLGVLTKHIKKNRGNTKLVKEIKDLVQTLETSNWFSEEDIKKVRPDADRVNPIGCYFFNIHYDRTLILIEINNGEAEILWCGSHQSYDRTFKNNKVTIRRWLLERKIIKK
ncbi:type II toxin-antitoxin system HigB family toxin [Portibacter marinus]|uniref:type II toxin-antitoxin system HigB family toxin n=1 Tax=Portibacter marinus TaxID=2898660 RepID=UPI001F34CAB0|nr:type II toxin-antitoxin system HigB family toxin [Portibacter marinus]